MACLWSPPNPVAAHLQGFGVASFFVELSHADATRSGDSAKTCSHHVAVNHEASTTLHTVNATIERIMMTIT
jgi:hypothetical protein